MQAEQLIRRALASGTEKLPGAVRIRTEHNRLFIELRRSLLLLKFRLDEVRIVRRFFLPEIQLDKKDVEDVFCPNL